MWMNNFFKRVRVAVEIVFNTRNRHICVMSCPKCGSINIQPLPDELDSNTNHICKHVRETTEMDFVWAGQAYCHSCGSTCTEVQVWDYPNG